MDSPTTKITKSKEVGRHPDEGEIKKLKSDKFSIPVVLFRNFEKKLDKFDWNPNAQTIVSRLRRNFYILANHRKDYGSHWDISASHVLYDLDRIAYDVVPRMQDNRQKKSLVGAMDKFVVVFKKAVESTT